MFRWLRTGNPSTFIYLLLYTLVVKFFYLTHPVAALLSPASDGLLYGPLVRFLRQQVGLGPLGFTVLSLFVILLLAVMLNFQVNKFRLLPGASYYPAFCFIVFSSFFSFWNVFSAPLVAAVPLLLVLRELLGLFDHPSGRTAAFNMGLFVGLAGLFYMPALALLLLIWFALLTARPFRLAEWILAVVGVLCPFYFAATVLFLTDNLALFAAQPLPGISIPETAYSYWIIGATAGLLVYFLYGSLRLQQEYSKMLIHIRKAWVLVLAFVIISLALPFLPDVFDLDGWLVAFLPMSLIIACGFWHVRKKGFALLLHLLALAFVLYLQWRPH